MTDTVTFKGADELPVEGVRWVTCAFMERLSKELGAEMDDTPDLTTYVALSRVKIALDRTIAAAKAQGETK